MTSDMMKQQMGIEPRRTRVGAIRAPERAQRVIDVRVGEPEAGASPQRPPGVYERFVKPTVDVAVAAFLVVLFLPLMAAVALALWATLGSPILFRQQRVGRGGRVFTVLKFRTMAPDRRIRPSAAFVGVDRRRTHKSPHDPRLVPVGRFLRKWSLDELPQLLNVVRGDMSLVGPRPELVEIVDCYQPWQHRRHEVKPGMTGLWQVSARGDGMMHEHVDIDLEYVDGVSLRTDASILLRTIPAALGRAPGY
jgi:lipopolysaccharide/colanic/teichoic acid biosynthesis glycosyltransferase